LARSLQLNQPMPWMNLSDAMEQLPLSVCIIARNEEHCIERCLRSVIPVAAQIVLVDTGSTDHTAAIARSLGAEVYAVPWTDDFAAARNESLRHAQQPWILVIDADEYCATPEVLAPTLARASADVGGFLVTVRSVSRAGSTTPTEYATEVIRLFRNDWRLRYEGIIHEQILPSLLRAGYRYQPSGIVIEHAGYNLDATALHAKHQRNLRLLDRALAAEPSNAFYRFHRAKTLMALGDLNRAHSDLAAALSTAQPDGVLRPQLLNHAALLAACQNRWTEAIAYAEQSLALLPNQPMSWFLIGEARRARGDAVAALDAYRHAYAALDEEDVRVRMAGTLRIPREELLMRISRMEEACRHGAATGGCNQQALGTKPPHSSTQQPLEESMPTAARPLITLAMIVRNEEQTLPRCLESVRGAVDEIIVVDTGSSDNTVAVAKHYGAEVYHVAWCDDFAAARNESLRHAHGEWILYLDADEQLTPESAATIRQLVASQPPSIGGLLCMIVSPHRQGSGGVETHRGAYPRLFRNYGYPRLAFRGRVHEQITPAIIECGGAIIPSPIVIWHSGYDIAQHRLEEKVRRNYRLLIQHVQEEPLNAYAWFQLGQTLARMQLLSEAEGALNLAIAIGLSAPLHASAASALAYLCGTQGRYQEALDWAEESLRIVPEQMLALYYKAHALEALGRYHEAHAAFEEVWRRLQHQHPALTVGFEIEIDPAQVQEKLHRLESLAAAAVNTE
jgi:glycosyltransferase involved in cell wall biosynthesis